MGARASPSKATYATVLPRAGASLVRAERLVRPSDPKLTANIDTRLKLDDGHAAAARIDLAGAPGRAAE
jgi:hypothetical protein